MAIRTTQDIQKEFPLGDDAGENEVALAFRTLAEKIIARCPSNRHRDGALDLITTAHRRTTAAFGEAETGKDKDVAAAKLAELFPDGKIPGADDPDPVKRMANALAAMKAEKEERAIEPIVEQPIEAPK